MAGARDPLRLRDWLVAQIESGRYAGLRWEDAGKTLFRIPWKHAARQGYRAQQDAALFRAWAIHKGKHLEGIDKEDPPTWKTRLRCALNKSADFREVRERHQLDSPDPYKVYRIVADGARGPGTIRPLEVAAEDGSLGNKDLPFTSTASLCLYHPLLPPLPHRPWFIVVSPFPHQKHPQFTRRGPAGPGVPCPVEGVVGAGASNAPRAPSPRPADCWLHVRLFYGATLVREATARTAEGCRLSPGPTLAAAERLLGPPPRVAQVRFPEPPPGARELQHLLRHLERGVLLWVAPEGVFAKRLCRGRVYWRGPLAPHRARPNKLERERTCQLLDTRRFLEELRAHLQDGRQEPEYQIRLCFGEEYPGPPEQPEERLIMAHVSHLPLQRRATPSNRLQQHLTDSLQYSAPDLMTLWSAGPCM
uniref:IRF tryptophan pentad repeat domain-containing protein n=1 Tax=Ursus americanus TaxID=9643 RepID=A0A452SDU6_URSAM